MTLTSSSRHKTIENVFPTTAILFSNESATMNTTHFRLFEMTLTDLVSRPEAEPLIYKVDLKNIFETIGTKTTEHMSVDRIFGDARHMSFTMGTLMMDLIDNDDDTVAFDRRKYTLAHMADSGELMYYADKYARQAAAGGELVGAQGVLTLWILGPFSIPLYPAFIACCAASSLIWYTIQPFVFCCII